MPEASGLPSLTRSKKHARKGAKNAKSAKNNKKALFLALLAPFAALRVAVAF
ncbi:MAG TPA: hypothetical protein VNX47_11885 [Nevskia sp.]|nr:hypothetical protein [Nevskia sp.]